MIEVYPCGIMVTMIYGNITGMITAFCIRFDRVQYEISYFNLGEQQTIWVDEKQFNTCNSHNKINIGFK